jgi:alpha-beta hydrolase superfamily lysophospholipase
MPNAGLTKFLRDAPLIVQHGSRSTDLVLVLHGWSAGTETMEDVVAAIQGRATTKETAALPDADLLVPSYPAGYLANTPTNALAQEIVDLLNHFVLKRREGGADYQCIILIGHSFGALLLRKALVYAYGSTEDAPSRTPPQPWRHKIRRLILFAGMNRGWVMSDRPPGANRLIWAYLKFLYFFLRRFPVAKLVRAAERGAPFLSDLRVQWLRLFDQEDAALLPITVQLLGTEDPIVREDDSGDLEAAATFRFRRLPGGDHYNVIRFSPIKHPDRAEWRRRFIQALTAPDDEIETDLLTDPLQRDPAVERVIFIVHGIRDYGDWTAAVAREISALDPRAVSRISRYGYFPMGDFLLLGERQKNVRWLMDRYTGALAQYPNAKFGFVGHSNGTYLLGGTLKNYKTPRFDRVVLAGCVLPKAFKWEHFVTERRVAAIQNYVASADWVVAWFPAIFEFFGGEKADLGSAGHAGFNDDCALRDAIVLTRGGHNCAIAGNERNLARYVLGEKVTQAEVTNWVPETERSTSVDLGHKFCLLIWMALVALALGSVFAPFLCTRLGAALDKAAGFQYAGVLWSLIVAGVFLLILKRV